MVRVFRASLKSTSEGAWSLGTAREGSNCSCASTVDGYARGSQAHRSVSNSAVK